MPPNQSNPVLDDLGQKLTRSSRSFTTRLVALSGVWTLVNKYIVHIMMESFIETSAKQGVGVEDAFKMLSKNILDRIENGDISFRLWCSFQA